MQSRRLANHIAKRVLSTAAPQEPALTRVSPQSFHILHFLLLFNRLKIPYDQLNASLPNLDSRCASWCCREKIYGRRDLLTATFFFSRAPRFLVRVVLTVALLFFLGVWRFERSGSYLH